MMYHIEVSHQDKNKARQRQSKTISETKYFIFKYVQFSHCHLKDAILLPAVKKHSQPARLKATDLISNIEARCSNRAAKSLLLYALVSIKLNQQWGGKMGAG